MEDGFKERAQATLALLGDERTSFVLIASPRGDTLDEARYFLDRIRAADLDASGVVVNRVLPSVPVTARRAAAMRDELAGGPTAGAAIALADLTATAADDQDRIDDLAESAPSAVVVTVPLLDDDVHDLSGLQRIADLLTA